MNFKDYLVEYDGNTDMLSSLKKLDKELLEEKIEENLADNIDELKENVIEGFEVVFSDTKDNPATKAFFFELLRNENSKNFAAYDMDIESLYVFVYKKDDYYTYYIPYEIKQIILKEYGLIKEKYS